MKALWMIVLLVLVSCATTVSDPSPRQVVTTERGDEVVAPRTIRRANPEYPEALRRQRVEGPVTLAAVIGVDGVPREIRIVQTSHPALNALAADALRKWRFEPATRNGVPVPVEFEVTIAFNVN